GTTATSCAAACTPRRTTPPAFLPAVSRSASEQQAKNSKQNGVSHARRIHRLHHQQQLVRDHRAVRPGARPALYRDGREGARTRRLRPGASGVPFDDARCAAGGPACAGHHQEAQGHDRAAAGLHRADAAGAPARDPRSALRRPGVAARHHRWQRDRTAPGRQHARRQGRALRAHQRIPRH
ncbi:hypothetical protein KXW50_009277, partial [Aspergillus fumigatus]